MNIINIAVLITCHNRKLKTLTCLAALFAQKTKIEYKICVYLVDDGSQDGTGDAVRRKYPQVKVMQGDGNLYWNGGMRLAFAEAMKQDCDYDYYLWLNDDTVLYPHALNLLLSESWALSDSDASSSIMVGATKDSKGKLSYGGVKVYSWWYPLKFRSIEPGRKSQACDTMSGNCVLIPSQVAKTVGNLDPAFIHNFGDFDYGLRAIKKSCSIWMIPGYIGSCEFHLPAWREPDLSLREKLKEVNTPKGMPLQEWKVYSQRHAGLLWPIYWLTPYIKLLITSIMHDLVAMFRIKWGKV
ncbi:MAG: glycosyltransferase family 2 protein [Cyanobacteria bacterium P01_A01_bin.83]